MELLRLAGTPIIIPRAVLNEIEQFGPADRTAMWVVKRLTWLVAVDAGLPPAIIERWTLVRAKPPC